MSSALAAGCVTISQPSPQIRDYRLEYQAPTIGGSPLPVVVSIPVLTVDAVYDRESIVYRPDDVSIGRYFYHRWSSNPGALIADLLKRDFARSELYRAVQSGGAPLPPDYQLIGEIEEIEERMLPDNTCAAHLAIRFDLVRTHTGEANPMVLREAYDDSESCACEDPRDLSKAMSKVMARVSESLQRAVYAAVTADAGA